MTNTYIPPVEEPPFKIHKVTLNNGEVYYTVSKRTYGYHTLIPYYSEVGKYATEEDARNYIKFCTAKEVKAKEEIPL